MNKKKNIILMLALLFSVLGSKAQSNCYYYYQGKKTLWESSVLARITYFLKINNRQYGLFVGTLLANVAPYPPVLEESPYNTVVNYGITYKF